MTLILGRNAYRPHRHDRDVSAVVRVYDGAYEHVLADELPVLFHHEVQLRDKIRVIAELMQNIMLQTAGAVDVPERLAYEIFYLMPLFGAFESYCASFFIHCNSSFLLWQHRRCYNFGKRSFTKIITSAVLLVKRFVYNCLWRGGACCGIIWGAQYDPWRDL